ncbi:MAG TPA: sulfotransferase [Lysobacter sp.]|nr:sulfotransferase [Lysobacter sp.]
MSIGPAAWDRAQAALARRDLHEARDQLQATLRAQPTHVQARLLLAGVCLAEGQLRDACTQLLQARADLPDDAATVCRVAQALLRVGESVAVRDCLDHPAIASCRDGSTLAALAHVQQLLGQHAESLALMERARACGFDNADFRYFRSIQLQFHGRLDEAEQELEGCLRMGPTYGRASLTLARLRTQTRERNHLEDIRTQLARVAGGSEDHAAFEFAQYKELEDLGEFDAAFAALTRANAIMHRRLAHDPATETRQYQALMAACDRDFLHPAEAKPQGPVPIFIIGLPRAGTTVLDRILGNHAQVTCAGELGDFASQLRWSADQPGRTLLDPALVGRLVALDFAEIGQRYLAQTQWRARGRDYFVDKLPANFMVAGLIAKALPHARLLHVTREPMDVCFSNYRALFGDMYAYSYDMDALAAHHRNYRRLMTHWQAAAPGRILHVDYQQLVTAPEDTAREVMAFCGLPYQAGCTDLALNVAPVATLSSPQVREGIHARGIAQWKRYERQLQPLWQALHAPDAP